MLKLKLYSVSPVSMQFSVGHHISYSPLYGKLVTEMLDRGMRGGSGEWDLDVEVFVAISQL